jgi:arylsulfatase A-like enzyme
MSLQSLRRRDFLKILGAGAAALALRPVLRAAAGEAAPSPAGLGGKPNILFIFADDMGYGDPRCFNADSKAPTPNIDRLATEGMKFTDAHAPVGLCVPSRYSLITGRYPFRSDGYRLRDGEVTIASLLKSAGYRTAMVGKWHLGFRYPPGRKGQTDVRDGDVLKNGPVDRGFDTYFGIPASLDIAPYYYIENDRVVAAPTGTIEEHHSPGWRNIQGAFWRGGGIAPGFKHEEVLGKCCEKALTALDDHKQHHADQPLLLYLALPAPHTPWLPAEKFRGASKAGEYGDYVAQVDDVVGQVLRKLDALGLAGETLAIFTSDNGPVWYAEDVAKYGHASAGPLRGMKADVWEGGHRMPFAARWPGRIKAGSVTDEMICFTDMMATFAEIAGAKLPENAGDDSLSILPLLQGGGSAGPVRETMVLQSGNGLFAIRHKQWKLILGPSSGGFSQAGAPKPGPGAPAGQLYDLRADLAEQRNLYQEKPEIVAELTALLEAQRKAGQTR